MPLTDLERATLRAAMHTELNLVASGSGHTLHVTENRPSPFHDDQRAIVELTCEHRTKLMICVPDDVYDADRNALGIVDVTALVRRMIAPLKQGLTCMGG